LKMGSCEDRKMGRWEDGVETRSWEDAKRQRTGSRIASGMTGGKAGMTKKEKIDFGFGFTLYALRFTPDASRFTR